MAVAQLPQFQGVDISGFLSAMASTSAGRSAGLAVASQNIMRAMAARQESARAQVRADIVSKLQDPSFFKEVETSPIEHMPGWSDLVAQVGPEPVMNMLHEEFTQAGQDPDTASMSVSSLFGKQKIMQLEPEKASEFAEAMKAYVRAGGNPRDIDNIARQYEATNRDVVNRMEAFGTTTMKPIEDYKAQMARAASERAATSRQERAEAALDAAVLAGATEMKGTPGRLGGAPVMGYGAIARAGLGESPAGEAFGQYLGQPQRVGVIEPGLMSELRGIAAREGIDLDAYLGNVQERTGILPGYGAMEEQLLERTGRAASIGARGTEAAGAFPGIDFMGEPAALSGTALVDTPLWDQLKGTSAYEDMNKKYRTLLGGLESLFDPVVEGNSVRAELTPKGRTYFADKNADEFLSEANALLNFLPAVRWGLVASAYGVPPKSLSVTQMREMEARSKKKKPAGEAAEEGDITEEEVLDLWK